MDEVCGNLREWLQDEVPARSSNMWNRQSLRIDESISKKNNIDVDLPRTVSETIYSSEVALHRLCAVEKLQGLQIGSSEHDYINEIVLCFIENGA